VFHYTRLERVTRDKHSSLLDSYASYEENEVVSICTHINIQLAIGAKINLNNKNNKIIKINFENNAWEHACSG
jgi:hypothetical protein